MYNRYFILSGSYHSRDVHTCFSSIYICVSLHFYRWQLTSDVENKFFITIPASDGEKNQ